MTPVARGILAFVLVAGAGPAGFLIYHAVFHDHPLPTRPADPALSAPSVSAPQPEPSSAPSMPNGPTQTTSTRSAPPLSLPAVSLPDRNGITHRLTDYRGHPLVLNFWATWCEPCRREIPLLQSLQREHGSTIQVVGVAVDFQKDVLPFAQAQGITYPLLMGEKDGLTAVNALGMDTALPFTVFADSQGDIVAVKVGELHADEARLILAEAHAVDAGKVAIADARQAISSGLRSLAIARAQQPDRASATGG